MKKLVTIPFLLFFCLTINAGTAFAQSGRLTNDEIKATNELTKQFNEQLDASGQIMPLLDKLFVGDFIDRYIKEETTRQNADEKGRKSILFTSGLDYDPSLLKAASANDWRQLYVSTFDFMQYGFVVMFNANARTPVEDMEPTELESLVNNIYPPDVMKMLNSNVITRNMLRKEADKRPIRTIEELRETSKILSQANQILSRSDRGKLTSDARKSMTLATKKLGKLLEPTLELCESECYGFKAGTRLISVFATPMHRLLILKMGENYKILDARHSSPD